MIRFRKGARPRELTELAATPGAGWDSVGAAQKAALRAAARRDQGGLCAYCQRRLPPDGDGPPGMKIEHWVPRSDPQRGAQEALRWANMLGVCLGGRPGTVDGSGQRHCDESRGNRRLFLHPVEGEGPDPTEAIRYTKRGVAQAAREDRRVAGDLAVLNLNADRLVRGREAVFVALWERLEAAGFTPGAMRRELDRHRIASGARTPEYAAFVAYHLRKRLRQRGNVVP